MRTFVTLREWTDSILEDFEMPGSGSRFTAKQDRQAKHVAASERARGVSPKKARSIGYATVNKQNGRKK